MTAPSADTTPLATGRALLAVLVLCLSGAAQAQGQRIYVSQDSEGRTVLSDQPVPGAPLAQVRTYPTGSATAARAERDHWRAQDRAFAQRHREREELAARERIAAAQSARERRYAETVDAYGWPRRVVIGGAPVTVPRGAVAPVYGGGPGAASRAPSAFLGSGFATAR